VKLLTPEDAAERLQMSVITVKKWLRSGKLKGVKPGGRLWRISEEELERFINESREGV